MSERSVTFYRWDDMPKEKVSGHARQAVDHRRSHDAGPRLYEEGRDRAAPFARERANHLHPRRRLRFWIGEDEAQVIDVLAGEVLHIPSMVQHKAEALEDTLDVDIFSPPRQDWLDKTDAYLRQK